ncbi:hypothetical protein PSDVSF_24110 [Pseudodesulfovibrio sediminis]|uniref:Uncharacterized protein n=1 Tax=Pseudodesulfovibrio sediminis TaxID=2810563 RepID=A0ABN6EVT0_9BACT|nr:hypothetical protein PSDVSF_24110 [Pseudodesulfovibrio sediminis]
MIGHRLAPFAELKDNALAPDTYPPATVTTAPLLNNSATETTPAQQKPPILMQDGLGLHETGFTVYIPRRNGDII